MNVLCVSGEQTQSVVAACFKTSNTVLVPEGFSSLGPLSSVVMEVTEKARNLALLPRPDPRTGWSLKACTAHVLILKAPWGQAGYTTPSSRHSEGVEWLKHPGDITGDLTSADHTDGSCTELPEGSTIYSQRRRNRALKKKIHMEKTPVLISMTDLVIYAAVCTRSRTSNTEVSRRAVLSDGQFGSSEHNQYIDFKMFPKYSQRLQEHLDLRCLSDLKQPSSERQGTSERAAVGRPTARITWRHWRPENYGGNSSATPLTPAEDRIVGLLSKADYEGIVGGFETGLPVDFLETTTSVSEVVEVDATQPPPEKKTRPLKSSPETLALLEIEREKLQLCRERVAIERERLLLERETFEWEKSRARVCKKCLTEI
ncbi:unnamed protein product [Arctogadus glacialis]